MEPDGQHHIGIPASMSNRVGAIADFNQEVARAAGAFRAPGVVDLLQRPTAARFTDRKLGERAFRSTTGGRHSRPLFLSRGS